MKQAYSILVVFLLTCLCGCGGGGASSGGGTTFHQLSGEVFDGHDVRGGGPTPIYELTDITGAHDISGNWTLTDGKYQGTDGTSGHIDGTFRLVSGTADTWEVHVTFRPDNKSGSPFTLMGADFTHFENRGGRTEEWDGNADRVSDNHPFTVSIFH